jgi:hypothetical protein
MKKLFFDNPSSLAAADPSLDVVQADEILEAIRFLAEHDLIGAVETVGTIDRDASLIVSREYTAQLLSHLADLASGITVEIRIDKNERSISAAKDGGDFSLNDAMKISRRAFLSGFEAELSDGRIILRAETSDRRALTVYAPDGIRLVKCLKKYV